jgi:hypothetical protein
VESRLDLHVFSDRRAGLLLVCNHVDWLDGVSGFGLGGHGFGSLVSDGLFLDLRFGTQQRGFALAFAEDGEVEGSGLPQCVLVVGAADRVRQSGIDGLLVRVPGLSTHQRAP